MPLLDMQRRSQVIGRIRTGYKNAKGEPVKSKTLIFTTANRLAAAQIAEAFGGQVREWAVRAGEYIVTTERAAVDVVVSPRGEPVTQWYEMWTAAGCARRCDSKVDQISGGPCKCPADPAKRAELASRRKPEACKPRTRISVILPDVSGMGVWVLATGSDQAACEVMDAGDLLAMARDQGILLPATLRLEQRETRIVGQPAKQYGVPVLEPHNTFREIASGELSNATLMAQLPPAPAQRLALTAGLTETATPQVDRSEPVAPPPTAQQLADRAQVATWRGDINVIAGEAKEHLLADDHVCTDPSLSLYEPLSDFLNARWAELPIDRPTVSAGAA